MGIIEVMGLESQLYYKSYQEFLNLIQGHCRIIVKISSIIELGSGFDSELSVKDNLNLYLHTIGYSKKK